MEIEIARGTGVYFARHDLLRIEETGELVQVRSVRTDTIVGVRVTRLRWLWIRLQQRIGRIKREVRWITHDRWQPEVDLDRWDFD